eukprot:CAMPEP_0172587782 /NCGR_PEP_ID=MMETSP1068-20121228/6788_1 /TAXON_ID=35684 /ORGANISM="Pseudopedinella elastica, Strain CCMP716" /LENGTH=294 /DNA_ID=CAMNT_0013382923 /DNA_START=59 /DNA_END=943 /DNA_ORIENTATION=-
MKSVVPLLALSAANAAEWYQDACFDDCWSKCTTNDCNLCDYYGDICAVDCSPDVQNQFEMCTYNEDWQDDCVISDGNWCTLTDFSCLDDAPPQFWTESLPEMCYFCAMNPDWEATWKPKCEEGGYCFYGESTVSVLAESGAETKKINELKVGDQVFSRTSAGQTKFAEVMGAPHSEAKEDYVEVKMGKPGKLVRATLHHTFPTCAGKTKKAMDIKSGDCLLGAVGKQHVHKVSRVKHTKKDSTYTLVMEKGTKQVAVGGVFTDTMRALPKDEKPEFMKRVSKPVITKAGIAKAK